MNKLEIYKHYKKLVVAEKFILTGSTVLFLQGLLKKEPGDLDIILINPDGASVEMLKRLRGDHKQNPNYPDERIEIHHEGVKIDFFISSSTTEKTFDTTDGITMAKVSSIIQAKKSYKRDKDFLDLMAISSSIFSKNDLISHLKSSRMNLVVEDLPW